MRTTLITGADGYLGGRIVAALLDRTDDHLMLTVRADDHDEFARKRAKIGSVHGSIERIDVEPADLSRHDALDNVDSTNVNRIVHLAAVTAFGIDSDTALRVNVQGTERIRDFGRRCPKLEQFVSLSTLYVAGRRSGSVDEVALGEQGFVNYYEWSKWAAEQVLLTSDSPPVTIARLPTVIADDEHGRVTQYNAFHNTLKLYFYGLLSLLPGDPATRLYLSTGEFVVDAIVRLLEADMPERIYHVCPDTAHTTTLGETVDLAFEVFREDEGFRRRHLMHPVECDWDSFKDLVSAGAGVSRGPINEAVGYLASFAEQGFLGKEFHNSAWRKAYPDHHMPPADQLIRSVCRNLVASRWGRRERISNGNGTDTGV